MLDLCTHPFVHHNNSIVSVVICDYSSRVVRGYLVFPVLAVLAGLAGAPTTLNTIYATDQADSLGTRQPTQLTGRNEYSAVGGLSILMQQDTSKFISAGNGSPSP